MAVGSSKMRWSKSSASTPEPAAPTSDVNAILTAFRMGQAMSSTSAPGTSTSSNASDRQPLVPLPPLPTTAAEPLPLPAAVEACGLKVEDST